MNITLLCISSFIFLLQQYCYYFLGLWCFMLNLYSFFTSFSSSLSSIYCLVQPVINALSYICYSLSSLSPKFVLLHDLCIFNEFFQIMNCFCNFVDLSVISWVSLNYLRIIHFNYSCSLAVFLFLLFVARELL